MPWVIFKAIICNILMIKENNALGKRSDNHESQNSVLNRRTPVVVSFRSSIYLHYGMFLLVDHSKRERLPYPVIAQISQPAILQLTTRSKNNEKRDAAFIWIFNLSTLSIFNYLSRILDFLMRHVQRFRYFLQINFVY